MTKNLLRNLKRIWFCDNCKTIIEETTEHAYHETSGHKVSTPLLRRIDVEEMLKNRIKELDELCQSGNCRDKQYDEKSCRKLVCLVPFLQLQELHKILGDDE